MCKKDQIMKYECKICNQKHEFYFGINVYESPRVTSIKHEDSNRVNEAEKNYYCIDNNLIVFPAVIEIKTNFQTPFQYETWVECKLIDFLEMCDSYKNEVGFKIEGKLFDELIPFYQNTIGLRCTIKFRPNMKASAKANVYILEESVLKKDQDKGLSNTRFEEFMNQIYHNKKSI